MVYFDFYVKQFGNFKAPFEWRPGHVAYVPHSRYATDFI